MRFGTGSGRVGEGGGVGGLDPESLAIFSEIPESRSLFLSFPESRILEKCFLNISYF